jgi:hypothetical protein
MPLQIAFKPNALQVSYLLKVIKVNRLTARAADG